MTFTVRTSDEPLQIIPAVRSVLDEMGTGRPIRSVKAMRENVDDAMGSTRFTLVLMTILAIIALVLSIVAVYSVITYLVRQRTHELGIRMALGASQSDIVMTNLREGLILVLVGIPIGLCGAALASGFLRSILFGVGATDPVTFVGVPLLLLAAALLASYLPARQASRINPAVALRQQE